MTAETALLGGRAGTLCSLGVWRSLVARSVRVGEVPSSNLGTPMATKAALRAAFVVYQVRQVWREMKKPCPVWLLQPSPSNWEWQSKGPACQV